MRQPSTCVHAFCEVVSCFTCHIWSSTSHFTLHTSHSTLHTSLFTLHSSHCFLHTPHFTPHTHTPHFTLHTALFTLHTALFTLHTALFTPHTSHCTLQTRCRPQRRNPFATETTPAATAAHTRYLSSPAATTLHRKIQGFVLLRLPPQSPCNIHAAITMHVAASRGKPASLYAHGNTRWQQSCSHSSAIRNRRFNTRIELRTQEQPLVAEHREGTHSRQKRPQPQPPHTRGTFHRRLQPLYTEEYKVSCSGFLPKSLTRKSHTKVSHQSLTPKSHTTLHWVYSYVM